MPRHQSARLPLLPRTSVRKGVFITSVCVVLTMVLCNVRSSPRQVLLIYAYQETDAIRRENLRYFLQHGISEGLDCVVVCNGPCTLAGNPRPEVTILRRENRGMDFGAWEAGLMSRNFGKYKYFIFLNSSVRGPFSPTYYEASLWWHALTGLLTHEVRLAGATISCMNAPHVQSYLFATDAIGLKLLLEEKVFKSSEKSHAEVIQNHEIFMSSVMLKAGYNIACLLRKYEGVDFRKAMYKRCNQQASPLTPTGYEGTTLHPFEVFFVKAKASDPTWLSVTDKYGNWTARPRTQESVSGGPITQFKRIRRDLADALLEKCGGVFDTNFYRDMHSDLRSTNVDLIEHWQSAGRYEGRIARYVSRLHVVSGLCNFVLNNPGFSAWIPQPYE